MQSLTSQMIDGVFPTKARAVGELSKEHIQSSDKRTTANAYYLAAQWHDKQAAGCDVMAKDEPRLGLEIRQRAAANAVHHRASAAGLRLSATGLLRADL